MGWLLIGGEGDLYGYFCAGGIGVDLHGALKLADAFAHAAYTDAGSSGSDLLKAFGGHARSVIADLSRDVSLGGRKEDGGFRRVGVAMDVGKGFLDEAEEHEFQIAGKPAEVVGDFDANGQSGSFGETSGVPADGGLQSALVQQRRMKQVGSSADLTVQLAEGLADSFDIGNEFRGVGGLLEQLVDFDGQDGEGLAGAVVEFTGNVTALFIASTHELPGEFLQLASTGADLGVEGLREVAQFFFTGAESFSGANLG